MSEANDLIERMEKETGQRIGDNDGDNNAVTGLLGAMSRLMGQSPPAYQERDDVVAGLLIKHHLSDLGKKQRERDKMIAEMIMGGMSPDDVKALMS